MHTVSGGNVNTVWIDGLWRLKVAGNEEITRNGKAIVLDAPIMSVYKRPWERVLFHPERNANPFFHLMEGLWMLAGSNKLEPVTWYNPRMAEFSDDGLVLKGAYGYRWRNWFEQDQLLATIGKLRDDPTSRQIVIAMWDAMWDGIQPSKDTPCNTHIYFRMNQGQLDMTVCCRSNDAVWGAYGANVVHFSMLHEFLCHASNLKQGYMYQFSNNFHIYERHWDLLLYPMALNDHYTKDDHLHIPLMRYAEETDVFLEDCELSVGELKGGYKTEFFDIVVFPAQMAWRCYKDGRLHDALKELENMAHCDWKLAMQEWVIRRQK